MEKIKELLNEQMNFEYESAYIYKAMAAYAQKEDYNGFYHFLEKQTAEEVEHGDKMKDFLNDLGFEVTFTGMEAAPTAYASLMDLVKKALEHEKEVTRRIHHIYNEAVEQKDLRTQVFLHWFIDEQVEEEATFEGLVTRLERIGDSSAGLYILDGELARR